MWLLAHNNALQRTSSSKPLLCIPLRFIVAQKGALSMAPVIKALGLQKHMELALIEGNVFQLSPEQECGPIRPVQGSFPKELNSYNVIAEDSCGIM